MAVRWFRMNTRETQADSMEVQVEDWNRVKAAGTTVTSPGRECVYAANWSDFSAAEAVRWYVDPWGTLHMQGAAKSGIAVVTPVTILTLPANLRPLQSIDFICPTAVVNASLVHLGINTSGAVAVFGATVAADAQTGVHLKLSFRIKGDQVPQ